jgi:formamidopyrimidine-DNA glycosylase
MPELPEIETVRRRLDHSLKNQKLITVKADRNDYIFFDEDEPKEIEKALQGAIVTGTGRKGKYFWLELNRKPWPVIHLGMSGNIEIRRKLRNGKLLPRYGWGGLGLWQTRGKKADLTKPPRFCRLLITLENGTQIAITDPRRFGRLRLSEDPRESPAIRRLGIDPLDRFPSAKSLLETLKKRRMAIKAVLLDQKVFAGVGNWIADEVLYQARLDPHRLAAELTPAEVARIRQKLMSILKTSVRLEADWSLYPKNWLFHFRWGKEKDAQDSRGRAILHETIGGRTTAWVPAVQYRRD